MDYLDYLRCPICNGELDVAVQNQRGNTILSGELICDVCQRKYSIKDGIPDFVLPEYVSKPDAHWMKYYDKTALSFDRTLALMSLLSLGWEPRLRRKWVERLALKEGYFILDVSTGTGINLPNIARGIGNQGMIFGMDISAGVLALAKNRIEKRGINAELQRANASYLPYKNDIFDGVLHVGGINTFGEKKRAIDEMIRVAKSGAKIVIVDEGLAPGKEKTLVGKQLLRRKPLYANKPPVELLPQNVRNLDVSWVRWGTLYVMEFKK